MAEPDKKKDEEMASVPMSILKDIQERLAAAEIKAESKDGIIEGLKSMLEEKADSKGEETLRKRKDFTPKFRSVRLRKYPVNGDASKLDYIVGWTERGAYEEVDRNGLSPQMVNYIEVFFLSQPKKAEKIRILDMLNKGIQVSCKVVKDNVPESKKIVGTGEEISVSVFDPHHGMVSTGEIVDGFTTYHDSEYLVEIPGSDEPVWISGRFLNA